MLLYLGKSSNFEKSNIRIASSKQIHFPSYILNNQSKPFKFTFYQDRESLQKHFQENSQLLWTNLEHGITQSNNFIGTERLLRKLVETLVKI